MRAGANYARVNPTLETNEKYIEYLDREIKEIKEELGE
jgi:hypothetical protein